jgi:histidinol dehydrogenase
VFGQVGIDMIAGPSEILVLADGSTPADWVAMDLFSQAEHDELAQSILLCPDAAYIAAVHEAIERLLPGMPRAAVIRASLEGRGALIHTRSLEEACAISNRIAPEHLEVSSAEPQKWEPVPSSWAPSRARVWATTAPAPTTCCPPAARRASARRWAYTTSSSARASSR